MADQILMPDQLAQLPPPPPLVDANDAAPEYLAARSRAAIEDPIARARLRLEGGRAAEAPGQPAPGQPIGGSNTNPETDKLTKPEPGAVAQAAGTVAQGVAELPGQALLGAAEGFGNTLAMFDGPANWLNDKAPLNANADEDAFAKLVARVEKTAPPKTSAGSFARSTGQFLTGFIPAARAMGGMRAATKAGSAGKAATAGAIGDFMSAAPDQARLADWWKSSGLPENVLTDYLASDPTDKEAEKRFKNALEGTLSGTLLDGAVLAVRATRSAILARKAAGGDAKAAAMALVERAGADTAAKGLDVLGDPQGPLLEFRKVDPASLDRARRTGKLAEGMDQTAGLDPSYIAGRVVRDAAGAELGDGKVMVNFARINTADDVKAVIGQMADAFAGKIDQARRGVQDNETTKKLADDLGLTVGDLLSRRKGQPFNAEEALAARQLWASSAEKLLEAARAAAAPGAGTVEQFNFRKMMAVHYAIQAEVVGARTETARALQSWRIPAGGPETGSMEKMRAVEQMMLQSGGPEATADIARRLAVLAEHGTDPGALSGFVRKAWTARSMDAVREAFVNGLLSNPGTHAVNMVSNAMTAFQQIYERRLAESISGFARDGADGGVAPGEAAALLHGLIGGLGDAFRLSAKALRTGEVETGGKLDAPHSQAIAASTFNLDEAGSVGRAVDLLGTVMRVPTRLLGAEDQFFKSVGYRMELRAQALRTATAEGREGADLARRQQEIIQNPPENVRLAAADAALYATFTNAPGDFGRVMLQAREKTRLGWMVAPFLKTPLNLARYGFERTPLAPLVGQWRDDIAAGGARADLALARMSTGTGIMLLAADMADRGQITGHGPPEPGIREAQMRQGWQPYSIRVGDQWVSYQRTDPIGMLLGFAADLAETGRRRDLDPDKLDEFNEVLGAGIAAVSQTVLDKTYMRGIAELIEAVGDPQRYAPDYVKNLVASFTPFAALGGATGSYVSGGPRDTAGIWEAVQAKIPGLAQSLPPRRDLWGEGVGAETELGREWDAYAPFKVRGAKESPIDAEIERQRLDIRRIPKRADWNGTPVNFRDWPAVYDEYQRLAGNALKHPAWDMGARDFLSAVVGGGHDLSSSYRLMGDGRDGSKADFIRGTISDFRRLARDAIEADPRFAEFKAELDRARRRRDEQDRENLQ